MIVWFQNAMVSYVPMLKFIGSVVASNFKRPSSPFKLSYAVTYRCNLKCKMCNIWEKAHHPEELKADDIGRFLCRPHKVYWLGITGGEPFLRQDLFDIVDTALSCSKTITALHFATNGTLTDRIERLVSDTRKKHKRAKIVFTLSVDGPPDVHNHIRGVPQVWNKTFETYRMLKKIPNVKPQFGFTLSHNNLDQFETTYEAIREAYPQVRFDDITVNIFQQSSFYYENHKMKPLEPGKVETAIQRILSIDRDKMSLNNFLRRRYLKLYLEYMQTKKSPVKCQSLASTCFLDPYGNLYPCAVYNRKVVNIRETDQSLKAIWRQKESKKIHKECAKNHCPSCWSPCDAYSAIGGSLVQSILR